MKLKSNISVRHWLSKEKAPWLKFMLCENTGDTYIYSGYIYTGDTYTTNIFFQENIILQQSTNPWKMHQNMILFYFAEFKRPGRANSLIPTSFWRCRKPADSVRALIKYRKPVALIKCRRHKNSTGYYQRESKYPRGSCSKHFRAISLKITHRWRFGFWSNFVVKKSKI